MLPYRHPELFGRSEERARAGTARVTSRSWLAIAGALLAAGALAGPAAADVRAGNTVTAFPDRDMIVVEGGYSGSVTVEVLRNGVTIGRAAGPAQDLADGISGLEVNHGPAGAARPGDCWDAVTPDVRGGDVIRVTDDRAGADEMVVGGVSLDPAGPQEALDGSIVLAAGAVQADGVTPMDLGNVIAEVRHKAANYRASGVVARNAEGAVTVTYPAPFRADRGGGTQEQQKQSIMAGDHLLTYSPVAAEVTIAELGAIGGPAPGCTAPLQADAVTSSDDAHVNLVSGDLTLSGTARAGTTAIEGSLTDSAGNPPVSFTGELSAGDGPKTWTATIPREALLTLADGPLVASAAYVTGDVRLSGATLKLGKDLVAPDAPASTPAPGVYTSAQSITLDHSDAEPGTRIHYTSNGSEPTRFSQRAAGPFIVTATQTIKALAIDPAGNPSPVASLAYRIEAPAAAAVPAPAATEPAPVPVPASAPTPTGLVASPPAPPVQAAPAGLRVSDLRVTSRRSARMIARRGLTVAFSAPAEVKKVRVRIMRGRTVIATRTVATATARGYSVRVSARELRRVTRGTYTVEATPVSGGRVTASRIGVRIGR